MKFYNKLKIYSGKSAFLLLGLILLFIAVTTFIEKFAGTTLAWSYGYGSVLFTTLWFVLVGLAVTYILSQKKSIAKPSFLLHLSLVIILLGALATRFTGQNGMVHLRLNEPVSYFELENGQKVVFPYTIRLESFEVKTYSGTNTPVDYQSIIAVDNPSQRKAPKLSVSMNQVGKLGSCRLYQTSYDEDYKGTILTVNNDPFGIPITYSGYFLMAVFMIWSLIAREGGFRKLLRHPLLKGTGVLMIALILSNIPQKSYSQCITNDSLTITKDQSDSLDRLCVLYNGRIAPLQTLALDFTRKITSDSHFYKYSATQFMTGWLLFPEKWQNVPMFKVKDSRLLKVLGLQQGPAMLTDFFTTNREYKLQPYLKNASNKDAFGKEILALNEKVNLVFMLHNGGLLKIFPHRTSNGIDWVAPKQQLQKASQVENLFIGNIFNVYKQNLLSGNSAMAKNIIAKIAKYQQKRAENLLPSQTKISAEVLYNRLDLFALLFKINLTLGLLGGLILLRNLVKSSNSVWFAKIAKYTMIAVFTAHTGNIILRTYISSHIPLSNGFETMLFVAWVLMGIGFVLSYRSEVFPVFALFLSGICLLVAHLGINNPEITPLVPVLNSVWLNIHVSAMMLAYALAAFIALFGFSSLLLFSISNTGNRERLSEILSKLTLLSRIFLYPCVYLMGTGIFLGAIWANQSWGRYWGWDPKESWALITFLAYAILLHSKTLKFLNNIYIFNLLAFLFILFVGMTFFGVNYFLGGMHSYAGNSNITGGWRISGVLLLIVTFLIISGISYRNYRSKGGLLDSL